MVSPRKSRRKSRVLLQHHDIDAGARQQEAEHHAGRPAAGDAASRADLLHGLSATPHCHARESGHPVATEDYDGAGPCHRDRSAFTGSSAFADDDELKMIGRTLALQPGRHVLVLAFELHAGRQRHGFHQGGEILLQIFIGIGLCSVAAPKWLCSTSRVAAVTGIGTSQSRPSAEAEVEVLAQQFRRERRGPVEIDQRRRLVAR